MSLRAEFAADDFYEFRTKMTEQLEVQRAQYLIVCESIDKLDVKLMETLKQTLALTHIVDAQAKKLAELETLVTKLKYMMR